MGGLLHSGNRRIPCHSSFIKATFEREVSNDHFLAAQLSLPEGAWLVTAKGESIASDPVPTSSPVAGEPLRRSSFSTLRSYDDVAM
jgi:hypothetical protein